MSYEIESLKSVEVVAEQGTAYGTNVSGTATYQSCRFTSADMGKATEMLPVSIAHQKKFDRENSAVGRKGSSLSLTSYMYGGGGTGLVVDSTLEANQDFAAILQAIMGGRFASEGAEVSGVPSGAGVFEVSAGSGSNFAPGQIVGRVNTNGKLEARQIHSISTDELTLHQAFSETPSDADMIYGSYSYFWEQNPTGSLQALVRGAESDDVWVLQGMQGGFSFALELGQLPTITFNLEGNTWSSGTAGAVSRQSYDSEAPPHFSDSDLLLYASGSFPVAASSVPFSSINVQPNVNWVDVMGAHAVSNVVDKVLGPVDAESGALTAEITLYYEDLTYLEALEQKTEYGLFIQIGSAPGKTVAISIPRMQITSMDRGDAAGIAGQTLTLVAHHDSYTESDGTNTELAESPYKIALL
ncbi:MAG: hypothetical protein RLP02_17915 [Coleofasciculus sp. C2-GNP5-27]